jgi:hypothetical protein
LELVDIPESRILAAISAVDVVGFGSLARLRIALASRGHREAT